MAKTAPEIILEVLAAAGQPVSLASLGKQCGAKGVKYATTSKAAQELTKRGSIILVKRGVYSLPVAAPEAAPATAVAPVGVLAPSLGSPCVAPAASADAPKTREALLAVFDADIHYCVNDLLGTLPGWSRSDVAGFLRQAINLGEVRSFYDEDLKANAYVLVGGDAPVASPVAPMSMGEARSLLNEIDPLPAKPSRANAGDAMNLRERLAAIEQDIEDAIGDACDAQLPHDLIKALVVANGAAHRAARLLVA